MAQERPNVTSQAVSRLRIPRDAGEPEPRRRGPLLIALVVGVVLIAALLVTWRMASGMRAIEVSTTTVLPPDVGGGNRTVLTASGYIVARRKAGVGPKVAGLLEWLGV